MRLLTETPPARQFTGPQPATVVRTDGRDLYVALELLGDLEVGPVAWSRPLAQTTTHDHNLGSGTSGPTSLTYDPSVPPPGTRCLVLFAGHGIADPWVVAFQAWPS